MIDRIRALLGRPRPVEDVTPDPNVARTRDTGGGAHDDSDSASTTGTGHSADFVGRAAGQDEGFAGESGAEARNKK